MPLVLISNNLHTTNVVALRITSSILHALKKIFIILTQLSRRKSIDFNTSKASGPHRDSMSAGIFIRPENSFTLLYTFSPIFSDGRDAKPPRR